MRYRFVPLTAIAAANCINIPLMRQVELREGIVVSSLEGCEIGKSKTAAFDAVAQVVHTNTHTHTHTHQHTHPNSLFLSHIHTHIHTNAVAQVVHTHTHTHTHTHIHTLFLSHTYTQMPSLW